MAGFWRRGFASACGISVSGVVARLRASLQRFYRATFHATDRSGRRAWQSRRDSAAALLGSWVWWQMQSPWRCSFPSSESSLAPVEARLPNPSQGTLQAGRPRLEILARPNLNEAPSGSGASVGDWPRKRPKASRADSVAPGERVLGPRRQKLGYDELRPRIESRSSARARCSIRWAV